MKKVNIVGAGLAGTSLAYVLKSRGLEVVIYEASDSIAACASGNEVGLYNPRFSAQKDEVGAYYSDAFFAALDVFEGFGAAIDFNPCGALNLITDERKGVRYRKCVDSWGWGEDNLRIVSAEEASEIAGITIEHEAMYSSRSGSISPYKLCHEYARGVEVHLNNPISDVNDLDGDVTILACGMGALGFEEAKYLPLVPVRGQVSYIAQNEVSAHLKTALCYGGYIAPAAGGVHCLGATFDRQHAHSKCFEADDLANLKGLEDSVYSLELPCSIRKSRAGVRVSSRDYFPVIGQLGRGVYISTAHGSHGILSTLYSANILSDMVLDEDISVYGKLVKLLSPARFMC